MKIELPSFRSKKKTAFEKKKEAYLGNDEPENPARRAFIKKGAILAAGVAAASIGLDKVISDKKKSENEPVLDNEEKQLEEQIEIEEAQERVNQYADLSEAELDRKREKLKPSLENKFEITPELTQKIDDFWDCKYEFRDKRTGEISKGKKALEEKKHIIEKYFTENGLPPEMIYLAIPESDWRPEVVSPSGAIGCFQVMPSTAMTFYERKGWDKENGRKLNKKELRKKVEKELLDIEINAEMSSDILKELFDAIGDSPDQKELAFSGYNGSFVWEYIKKLNYMNEKTGFKRKAQYSSFLALLEIKIEKQRQEVLRSESFERRLRNKDAKSVEKEIGRVASRYNVPANTIVKNGRFLTIPYTNDSRPIRYSEKVSGYWENYEYTRRVKRSFEHMNVNQEVRLAKADEKVKKEIT